MLVHVILESEHSFLGLVSRFGVGFAAGAIEVLYSAPASRLGFSDELTFLS